MIQQSSYRTITNAHPRCVSQSCRRTTWRRFTTLCWSSSAAVSRSCSGCSMTRGGCQGNRAPSSFVAKPMPPAWTSWCGPSKMSKVINCGATWPPLQSREPWSRAGSGRVAVLCKSDSLPRSIFRSWESVHQTVGEAAVQNFQQSHHCSHALADLLPTGKKSLI